MSRTFGIFPFQTSIEAIRAHHWRSVADAYSGCAFNCQYCLYKGPGDYGTRVQEAKGTSSLDMTKGILNIGSTTDPYQPIERTARQTRSMLESAAASGVPVFLLTRGTMVERDIDVLTQMASGGRVEVCISIITLRDELARKIEPRAPRPSERLAVAERLADHDIPVSFHVAPLIPGLDSESGLVSLGRTLGRISGRHVFSAVLGAQRAFWHTFSIVMKEISDLCYDFDQFTAAYPGTIEFSRGRAVTCELPHSISSVLSLRKGVSATGATFVSENYPYLSTAPLIGGIYRWKIPTVYDMVEWISTQNQPIQWHDFDKWYSQYQPPSYQRDLVQAGWETGELFFGTHLERLVGDYAIRYRHLPNQVTRPANHSLVVHRSEAAMSETESHGPGGPGG